MINVKAAKLVNVKFEVDGGYELLNGWTVKNDLGQVYAPNGRPWLPRGGKSAAMEVQASGLLDGAKFIDL